MIKAQGSGRERKSKERKYVEWNFQKQTYPNNMLLFILPHRTQTPIYIANKYISQLNVNLSYTKYINILLLIFP